MARPLLSPEADNADSGTRGEDYRRYRKFLRQEMLCAWRLWLTEDCGDAAGSRLTSRLSGC
jgi:hypothetical protein